MQLPLQMVTMATLSRNFFFFFFNFCKKEEKSIMAGQFSKRKKVSMSRKTFALKIRSDELQCEARYLLDLFSG